MNVVKHVAFFFSYANVLISTGVISIYSTIEKTLEKNSQEHTATQIQLNKLTTTAYFSHSIFL